MRFLFRSLLGLFLFATAAGLLAMAGYTIHSAIQSSLAEGERPRAPQERVFAARVVSVVPDTVTPVLETFGEVRALRSLELRVPVSGRVVELAPGFADGTALDEGQLVLRLDDADARATREVARADLLRAEAELRDARTAIDLAREDRDAAVEQQALRARALERQRDLLARGVGTDAAVETAELALSSARQAVVSRRQAEAQAEARVDQADTALARQRLTLAEAERRLADTELYASFAGTLSEVTITSGGIVSANERIGRIIDPDALEVAFRVSTAQYLRLIDGEGRLLPAPVEIALDMMGTEILTTGQLSRVGAAVGEGQTGRLIHARIEAPRGFLPGDFVTLRVQEPSLDAVALLPATAIDAAGEVLVLDAQERLEPAAVEVLRRQGDMVLVRAPDIEGREVVAERTPLLGAGIRVRPIRPQSDDADPEAGSARPDAGSLPVVADMIELSSERRAQLIAYVEGNRRMPEEARNRILVQLSADRVPAQVVEQLENRMRGG